MRFLGTKKKQKSAKCSCLARPIPFVLSTVCLIYFGNTRPHLTAHKCYFISIHTHKNCTGVSNMFPANTSWFYCQALYIAVVLTEPEPPHTHTFPNTFIPGKWRQRHWWECGVWSICATWWTEENGQGGRRRRKKRMNTNSHLSLICRPSTERQTHSRLSGSAQTAWSRFRRRMEGIHTACRQRFTKSNIPSVIQCLIHIFSLFVIHSLSY